MNPNSADHIAEIFGKRMVTRVITGRLVLFVAMAMMLSLKCTYLRFDQYQIDEEDNIIMLNIFIGESLAVWTLREAYTLAKCSIISFAVRCVEMW